MDSKLGPVTQILLFQLPEAQKLLDDASNQRRTWNDALQVIEQSEGCQHLAWGVGVERAQEVQVHITRRSERQHQKYLHTLHAKVLNMLSTLTKEAPTIRNVPLSMITPGKSPFSAPVTGTAVYLGCTNLWDAAWNLWTHIVPSVDGCSGIAGGYLQESVKGNANNYLVYVGWESIEKHNHLHHTEFFKDRWIILNMGHNGWTEYGHVKFIESRHVSVSARL